MTTFYLIGTKTESAAVWNSASATCATAILIVIVERDTCVVLITSKCSSQRSFYRMSFKYQRGPCSHHSTLSTSSSSRVSYKEILRQYWDEYARGYPRKKQEVLHYSSVLGAIDQRFYQECNTPYLSLPMARVTTSVKQRKRSLSLDYGSHF